MYDDDTLIEEARVVDTALYRADAPGDWGTMQAPDGGITGTSQLVSSQRDEIFYRYWRVNGPATLLIMHGLGAHSGWFIDMGNSLARQGINVYAMDHAGFGRSGGKRGHTDRWHSYVENIDRVIDVIRKDIPQAPVFILGHSMGGVFAIHYAAEFGPKLAGVILLNPWIADQTRVNIGTLLSIAIGGMFHSSAIGKLPDVRQTQSMTSNPEAVELLLNDPYWTYERTKSFYWQISQMRSKTIARTSLVYRPLLVLQAEADKAVIPAATRKAYDAIRSADKTYITYPAYGHDSEFERDRAALDNDIKQWIMNHVGG
jgi:alpha-beta hydrolase superfamily lysophospholipase